MGIVWQGRLTVSNWMKKILCKWYINPYMRANYLNYWWSVLHHDDADGNYGDNCINDGFRIIEYWMILLCASHYTKYFTRTCLCVTHNNQLIQIMFALQMNTESSEKLSKLPKVTQLISPWTQK